MLPKKDLNRIITPRKNQSILFISLGIWAALYKKSFLEKNQLRFQETPGASYQDTGFAFRAFAVADRVYLSPKAHLHYRIDHQAASSKSQDKVFCICDEFSDVENYLSRHPEIKKMVEKTKNRHKYLYYKWNYKRIAQRHHKTFLQRISSEFQKIIRENSVNKSAFSLNEWAQFQHMAYPDSAWHWFKYRILTKALNTLFNIREKSDGTKVYVLLRVLKINVGPSGL